MLPVFSGLRVYTITGCNKTITALVLFVGMVPAVTSLVRDPIRLPICPPADQHAKISDVLTTFYTATTDPIAYMGLPEISSCSAKVTYGVVVG